MIQGYKKGILIVGSSLVLVVVGVVLYRGSLGFAFHRMDYVASSGSVNSEVPQSVKPADVVVDHKVSPVPVVVEVPVTHIKTPAVVKSVYMSAWVAGSAKYRDPVVALVDQTELNAVVIDVKDSTGRISFTVSDPALLVYGSAEKRIPDIRALTAMLHQKNIYIIGRVAVFQDPYMTKIKPEWSITKKSDGTVWKDRKGLSFLDPASVDVHKYIVAVAHEAYKDGFDEINFDYIRYPSDGNLKDINYHLVAGKTRADNIEAFFKYLSHEVKKDDNIPMSADLFGLTTEVSDDMGIGQVWEKAYPYFDYLAPMIYPSHYPPGQNGYKNPAEHPYEMVSHALQAAIKKTQAIPGGDIHKIRPWLQDFNLGAKYTKELVHAQMKATYDAGLTSWMLWDPRNKYTPGALELETGH